MRVEGLTRELIQVIDTGTKTQREDLRELAIDLLRNDVVPVRAEGTEADPPTEVVRAGFNPFGIAILLLMMGGVLVILFPLVGLLMFLGAAVMIVWGFLASVFARS